MRWTVKLVCERQLGTQLEQTILQLERPTALTIRYARRRQRRIQGAGLAPIGAARAAPRQRSGAVGRSDQSKIRPPAIGRRPATGAAP
jgi:hypothetical protein